MLLFFTVVVCMQADANRKIIEVWQKIESRALAERRDRRFESRPLGERREARGGSKL